MTDETIEDNSHKDEIIEDIPQKSPDLEILFHDKYFVAVNKTSGLLVHRSWLDPYATEFALQKVRDQIGQYVYPVHRLDRPTSGVLLFALDKDCARDIMEQFLDHKVVKHYIAVVRGHLDDGELNYPLKEKLDKIADQKASKDKPAQEAYTDFICLDKTQLEIPVRPYPQSRYSLMRLIPSTGRKHQLRRHMAHLRHPIIGDTSHGDGKHNIMFRDKFNSERLLLHSEFLSFTHTKTGELIKINAPLHKEFTSLLDSINLSLK